MASEPSCCPSSTRRSRRSPSAGDEIIRANRIFLESLTALLDEVASGSFDGERANRSLRKAFLAQNSETPDNLAAVERLQFSAVQIDADRTDFGLSVGKHPVLLSEIVWLALENERGVELIQSAFPQLTREDAVTVLRVCTAVFTSLDATVFAPEADE